MAFGVPHWLFNLSTSIGNSHFWRGIHFPSTQLNLLRIKEKNSAISSNKDWPCRLPARSRSLFIVALF